MSRMTPQRTTTLDFIDPKIPPTPDRPYSLGEARTAPRGLEAAQQPRLASANAQLSSLPPLPI
eukprot:scaffold118227_cov57-Phaeocystis_antarctica.AAC.1